MIRDRRWLWLLAALPPLLYLPLQAQESAPAADAPVATPPADDAPAPAEERVSADNNLSFPVDI